MSDKELKPKPQVYAFFFAALQEVAKELGYNLLIHGSMNRDMDLVAVPWIDDPADELTLIKALHKCLTGETYEYQEQYLYSRLPGGRNSYAFNLNRGRISKKRHFS